MGLFLNEVDSTLVHSLPSNSKDFTPEGVGMQAYLLNKTFELGKSHISTPKTIVIDANFFDIFLKHNRIIDDIIFQLKSIQPFYRETARDASKVITSLVMRSEIPVKLLQSILKKFDSVFKNKNLFNIIPSHIISNELLTDVQKETIFNEQIKSILDLSQIIKLQWAKQFSVDALELRANRYYVGPISVGIIISESIPGEASGKYFTFPPTTRENNLSEIHASYGLTSEVGGKALDLGYDTYKIEVIKNSRKIFEKKVVSQELMYLRKNDDVIKKDDIFTKVEISGQWKFKQKLSDSYILEIVELANYVERALKIPIIIDWILRGGSIYIKNIAYLEDEFTTNDIQQQVNKALDIKPHPVEEFQIDWNLEKIKKEIEQLKLKLDKTTSLDKSKIENSLNKTIQSLQQYTGMNVGSVDSIVVDEGKANNKSDFKYIIDVSSRTNDVLTLSLKMGGAYVDATSILLERNEIPEYTRKSDDLLTDYIQSVAFDVSTLYKISNSSVFFYQLPNLTDYEYSFLLKGVNDYLVGDDRYILNPSARSIEIAIIKNLYRREFFEGGNIVFPGLRNVTNLTILLDYFSKQGIGSSEKLKIFAEISIPSFLIEVSKLPFAMLDGLIINYQSLLKLINTKRKITELDHNVLMNIIEDLLHNSTSDLQIYVRLEGNIPKQIVKRIINLPFKGVISQNF